MEGELIVIDKALVEKMLKESKSQTYSMTMWEAGYTSGKETILEWLLDKTTIDLRYLK